MTRQLLEVGDFLELRGRWVKAWSRDRRLNHTRRRMR